MGCKGLEEEEEERKRKRLSGAMLEEWVERQPMKRRFEKVGVYLLQPGQRVWRGRYRIPAPSLELTQMWRKEACTAHIGPASYRATGCGARRGATSKCG